jgi:hypothetical protein
LGLVFIASFSFCFVEKTGIARDLKLSKAAHDFSIALASSEMMMTSIFTLFSLAPTNSLALSNRSPYLCGHQDRNISVHGNKAGTEVLTRGR